MNYEPCKWKSEIERLNKQTVLEKLIEKGIIAFGVYFFIYISVIINVCNLFFFNRTQ